jgi:hypothetical protein
MNLKNIYNRKDYLKLNEFLGGSEGGVGAKDGFANNTKLKDSMIGKLFNGTFKGIGWLYRKTKEFFAINKLNAQLVNELMRGVILFCFANNLDLKTGKKLDDEELKNDEKEEDKETIKTEEPITAESEKNYNTMSKKVDSICKNKYNFNPEAKDFSSPLKDTKIIPYPTYVETINEKDYDPELICIGDKFRIINSNGKLEDITISNINTKENIVTYYVGENNKEIFPKNGKGIPISSLLPSNFAGFDNITKTCDNFLRKNIIGYDDMSDDDKVRLETVFMHYKLIKKLNSKTTTASAIKENLNVILSSYSIINEAISRVKLDDPQAGKTTTPSITLTVKDILTKRDREKFKDNDDLNIPLRNINLAEIEKFVEEKDKVDRKTKSIVSSYVNIYNLKTIQLSADQLMVSRKNVDSVENNKLKLKWNKTVSKTNASFSGIMDMSTLDITNSNIGGDVDISKVKSAADKVVNSTKNQIEDAKISSKLPLIDDKFANYTSMQKESNSWCYYSFKYNDKFFKVAISPYQDKFDDYGLVRITTAFTDVDETKHTVIPDDDFFSEFLTMNVDEPDFKKGTPVQKNIYFMFKYNALFPASNDSKIKSKVLVFNEFIMRDGKTYLFLKMKGGGNLTVNIPNISNLNMKDYIYSFDLVINNRHFNLSKLDQTWKKSLNFTNTDLRIGNKPECLNSKNKTIEAGLSLAGAKLKITV